MARTRVSVNAHAWPLVERLVADAETLRLSVERPVGGIWLIDAGVAAPGSLEAGRRIAEIAMGGLGTATFGGGAARDAWPFSVCVQAPEPVTACLCAQYAGWALDYEEGGRRRTLMVSGPGRAKARRERLYAELGYADEDPHAVFLLETGRRPSEAVLTALLEAAGSAPEETAVIVTPTASAAGLVQIAARVLEVGLHKVHELHFPLDRIREGIGRAPLPPASPDPVTAMGRSNDAILLAGEVWLWVDGPEADVRELARALPSTASPAWGRPFAEIFREVGGDFYAIDRMLFSPARVVVTALESGRSFVAGRIEPELLARSFEVETLTP